MQKSKEIRQEKQGQEITGCRGRVKFIVTREFTGSQTMQEAFEQLIERQACECFEKRMEKKAG